MEWTYEPVEQPPLKPLEAWWWEEHHLPMYLDRDMELPDQEARDDFDKMAQDYWPENNNNHHV